jgi:hypothetical protein
MRGALTIRFSHTRHDDGSPHAAADRARLNPSFPEARPAWHEARQINFEVGLLTASTKR